jgi:outer membrane protein assembly factor BamE (lipoprotein component of BamABCDE complex)
MTHRRRLLPAAALLTLALAGCHATVDPRGNLPTPEQLSQIKPGVTDKATVTRILGSPSSVAEFEPNTWYYISQKTKEIAFFKPEIIDQQVLAIDFDKDGTVHDVRRRTLDDRVAVSPNPHATPAPGREFTVWEQLIGNFGRFSSAASGLKTGGGGGGGTGGSAGYPGGP